MKIQDKIKELVKGTVLEDYGISECETAAELIESLQEQIDQDEVIYFSNAMKYLSENDASLTESIDIAVSLGYGLSSVTSELLATLHQQQANSEALSKITSEIEAIYEEDEA